MPAESEAQRGFLYATKGEAWAKKHHFDNKGKLPKYKKASKDKAKSDMVKIANGLRVAAK